MEAIGGDKFISVCDMERLAVSVYLGKTPSVVDIRGLGGNRVIGNYIIVDQRMVSVTPSLRKQFPGFDFPLFTFSWDSKI